MAEGLETEVKTNPQGDVITATEAPKAKPKENKAAKQRVVTPEHLFFEAPRTKTFITGSEAAKEAIRRANVDIAISYPITPQSETMQQVGISTPRAISRTTTAARRSTA